MNEKKICFIACTNDEFYMKECEIYLEELVIPEGYEIDLLKIADAKSMTAGYNEAMKQSDAKYKVYLHQDVFIINKNFLVDMLELFHKDEKIGLIGMVGTPYLECSGTMRNGVRFGNFYKLAEGIESGCVNTFYPMYSGYMEMEVVDGLLMATQYDIPWREDIFKKWDFYDVSQCFEFNKAGYKVVVPGQQEEWYIHDCGGINLDNYQGERQLFLENYKEYMEQRKIEDSKVYLEKVREHVAANFHGSEEELHRLLGVVDMMMEKLG